MSVLLRGYPKTFAGHVWFTIATFSRVLPDLETISGSSFACHFTMIFHAYPEEQRDLRWVTVFLTTLATLLLITRISSTIRIRGWLGLEDYFVIMANVSLEFELHNDPADQEQISLVFLAAFIYTATTYGFGMRVDDIKATGGNVTQAMKVSNQRIFLGYNEV